MSKYELIKYSEDDKKFLIKSIGVICWVYFIFGLIVGFLLGRMI